MNTTGTTEANMIKITNDNFKDTIEGNSVVLVAFKAPWCGPCRTMGPILEEVAKETEGKAIIAEVNVDNDSELTKEHSVRNIPATFIYKDGEVMEQFISVKQKNEIVEIINKYL